MSNNRILYYDLETKDIIKIFHKVDNTTNEPYFKVTILY